LAQLPIEQESQIAVGRGFRHGRLGHFTHLPFPYPSAGGQGSRFKCGTVGHPIEPVAHKLAHPQRRRFVDQHEERGLESILGVMRVPEHPAAHTEDHRLVPPHQRFKSRFILPVNKAIEQLPVAGVAVIPQQSGTAQMPNDPV